MSWSKAEIRNGNWLPGTRFVEVTAYEGAREDEYRAIQALEDLIEWESTMGGWEAPCWDKARGVVRKYHDDRKAGAK